MSDAVIVVAAAAFGVLCVVQAPRFGANVNERGGPARGRGDRVPMMAFRVLGVGMIVGALLVLVR